MQEPNSGLPGSGQVSPPPLEVLAPLLELPAPPPPPEDEDVVDDASAVLDVDSVEEQPSIKLMSPMTIR